MEVGGHTSDSQIAEQLVRVRGLNPVNEVDLWELSADDRGSIELLELVQNTSQLKWLLVAGEELSWAIND
jgi:hypothetical protein